MAVLAALEIQADMASNFAPGAAWDLAGAMRSHAPAFRSFERNSRFQFHRRVAFASEGAAGVG